MSTIEMHLEEVRSQLDRVTAAEARAAMSAGAVLVDTRTETQRARYGEVPGALVINRTILEWRLDPTSANAVQEALGDPLVIVLCQEGYSSSLAAASLRSLGVNATDVVGGFDAWHVGWDAEIEGAQADLLQRSGLMAGASHH
ncbi:rhodanese-like domain-containing protein [Knoellia sp. CPCC 206453]|uniref:rhodanese-like domain-containing protein n=1 Tax=Knoellia pratensis TaxID=3404796 RepID=UPI00361A7389